MAAIGLTNRWAVLALMVATRICFGFQFQSIPPLTAYLLEDLGINYTQLGLLIGLYISPGVVIALPGGMLGQRFGDKAILVAGMGLMTLGGVLVGTSGGFNSALLGRLAGGTGGVMITVQQAKIITERFAGREIATAMSILLAGYPTGIAIALSGLGPLAEATSWQQATLISTAFIALVTLLVTVLYANPPPASSGSTVPPRLWHLSRRELAQVAASGQVWMFLNAAFIVYLGFMPALLIGRGTPAAIAGVAVSLTTWVSLCTVPLGGHLTDRFQRPNTLIVAGSLFSAGAIAAAALLGTPWVWALAYGVFLGLAPGAIMSLPGEVLSPDSRSTGFGVFYALYYLGLTVFPPIAGWLRDTSGSGTLPVLFGAALMMLTIAALALFRWSQRRLGSSAGALRV